MSKRGDNIRKRKDGRWEGRYIYKKDDNGKSQYKSVYGKTYSEVRGKLNNKSIEKNNNNLSLSYVNNTKVNAIAELWLQEIKTYRKYSTYVKYSDIYRKYIQEVLGNREISLVTNEECNNLLQNCSKKELSYSTICSLRNVINQIMRYGKNPVEIVSKNYNMVNSEKLTRLKISVFTRDEQQRLQRFLLTDMDRYKLGIYMCMFTGMRLGEICALKTENIDLTKKVILVSQTVQRIKSENVKGKTELQVSSPKTRYSLREIPICNILLDILYKYMPCTIFLLNGNFPMEPRTYQYYFERILKELGLKNKNFHALRHTFATNCIDSGMDIKCLCEILGHSDVKTTLNKYVHPSYEQKIKQIDCLASEYGHYYGQE